MFKKVRAEWKAAGEALDRNAARRARKAAKQPKPEITCRQYGCDRAPERQGYCEPCWLTAVF